MPSDSRPALREIALATLKPLAAGEAPELALLHQAEAALGGRTAGEALALRRAEPGDDPLLTLAGRMNLGDAELIAVALALAVEEDALVGRAVAALQAPLGGSRPTLGLLALATQSLTRGSAPLILLSSGVAARAGLLVLHGEGAPLVEQAVGIPAPLVQALCGDRPAWSAAIREAPAVPLPPGTLALAARQAAALSAAPGQLLVLRSGSEAEAQAVAQAIAGELGKRAIFLENPLQPGLGPLLLLTGHLPVFLISPAPGETRVLPAIPAYDGPILALSGPDGAVASARGPAVSWTLPLPSAEEREALWRQALGTSSTTLEGSALAARVAREHRHGAGRIAELGALLRHEQALREQPPSLGLLRDAAWSGGAGLETLAQPLRDEVPDAALVLPAATRRELEILLQRCAAREDLAQGLGVSATTRYRSGVRALLVGPSGTGKTLAASWLATRLGIPLYRVDLASVVSKYIGETEKNLAQLLARAESAEVVLLFDEADALFGKRTEVRQANDRFANAQTNYLLQRIETYEGVVLLTSNSRSRFDDAFARRLDLIVDFPAPGPAEQRALWQAHLGPDHGLTHAQLNMLAATGDLTGGHIRNVVLTAAVLSRAAGRALTWPDLVAGLGVELRKSGRQLPPTLTG